MKVSIEEAFDIPMLTRQWQKVDQTRFGYQELDKILV